MKDILFKIFGTIICVPLVIVGVICMLPIIALILLINLPICVIQDIWDIGE